MSEHKIEGALHIVAGPRKPPDLSGHTDDVEHHFGDARSGPPRSWQWRGLPPPLPRAPIRVDDYVDEANAQQGIYLSAIGGLVQFNAIVATVQGSVITLSDVVQLRTLAAVALVLHAAFVLCWAARPVVEKRAARREHLANKYRQINDTFLNYRRGWRTTLLALAGSGLTILAFLHHEFGIRWIEAVTPSKQELQPTLKREMATNPPVKVVMLTNPDYIFGIDGIEVLAPSTQKIDAIEVVAPHANIAGLRMR